MLSWHLLNAAELAARHRYVFYRPSAADIATIKVGEAVKLIFGFDSSNPSAPGVEHIWVQIDVIGENGTFRGHLREQPHFIEDLPKDAVVEFKAAHIAETEYSNGQNQNTERFRQYCFVTKRVLKGGARIAYLYRETPDLDDDSGWRIMAGDESPSYLRNVSHLSYVPISTVLRRDDSFVGLLNAKVGSVFIRDPETGQFKEVFTQKESDVI